MRLFIALIATALCAALCACGPTIRETLMMDTANYTQCGHVDVECVDDDCSNVQGGPWMATACGTRYRCTNTAGEVVCVPKPQ